MSEKTLKLLKLKAQNVMALEAFEVEFTPEGDVTIFSGRNDIGKSTALNSIAMALGGKKLCPDEPLRHGQESGYVEVELGEFHPDGPLSELKIKRVFGKGEKLVVTDAEGVRSASPQAILDKLVRGIGFDPRAFVGETPKRQAEILKELAGLDFTALDDKRDDLYQSRHKAGILLKQAEGELEGIDVDPEAPDALVDISKLQEEIERAQELERMHGNDTHNLARATSCAREAEESIKDLEEQLETTRHLLSGHLENIAVLQKDIDAYVAPGTEEMKTALRNAGAINEAVRDKQKAQKIAERIDELKGEQASFTSDIERIDEEKRMAVASADLPVDGLEFDEDGVRWNGTLLSQIAFSESLRISTAIGLALKPALPIVLIDQGSELDDEHLKMVARLAHEKGAQVVMTQVGASDAIEVHFVSGDDGD